MQSKRIAGQKHAKYPDAFKKAVVDGVKRGERYVDTCRRIEENKIACPNGDLYGAVRAAALAHFGSAENVKAEQAKAKK